MDPLDKPLPNDDPKVQLTIRLIMQGKEVGSIIGKKGEIVKRFREEATSVHHRGVERSTSHMCSACLLYVLTSPSDYICSPPQSRVQHLPHVLSGCILQSGAKINISDGSCPERIVTVTGPTNSIFKAFTLICKKFEEWCSQFQEMQGAPNNSGIPRPPITLRLIVPASQCGSLIGKGGSKIKEIREVTGASIQVASEMLPNSTERAVTISGTSEAITQCIYHICCVMLESPPKGATIPYRPKPQVAGPVILAGGQAYTIQGNYAVPAHADVSTMPMFPGLCIYCRTPPVGPAPLPAPAYRASRPTAEERTLAGCSAASPLGRRHFEDKWLYWFQKMGMGNSPLAGLAALGLGGLTGGNAGGLNPAGQLTLAALAGSQLRTNNQNRNQPGANQQSHEMTVPNELIGCIIGKGGTKIAEIRQISGAMIRISNCEEREGGTTDRTITIQGNPDSVALAQYLINMSSKKGENGFRTLAKPKLVAHYYKFMNDVDIFDQMATNYRLKQYFETYYFQRLDFARDEPITKHSKDLVDSSLLNHL
uniref:K Homology domain-containing protein n=1 Tax=Timema genevievae TaxID=629358 RepID=A0A7R9PJW9_TIMGE|nr:unnamed protein product [Timema genevievae]